MSILTKKILDLEIIDAMFVAIREKKLEPKKKNQRLFRQQEANLKKIRREYKFMYARLKRANKKVGITSEIF